MSSVASSPPSKTGFTSTYSSTLTSSTLSLSSSTTSNPSTSPGKSSRSPCVTNSSSLSPPNVTSFTSSSSTDVSSTSPHAVASSSSVNKRTAGRKNKTQLSQFFSKYRQHLRHAKLWVKDTYAFIKATHDKDVQARKQWQKQFEDKVWFPPRKDDKVTKEVERIFGEFETYFKKERRQRPDSKQSLPVLCKPPSRH